MADTRNSECHLVVPPFISYSDELRRSRSSSSQHPSRGSSISTTNPSTSPPSSTYDPNADPLSLSSTMSIVRLFVKNNPEGCPIFEISSTRKEVVRIIFPPRGDVDTVDDVDPEAVGRVGTRSKEEDEEIERTSPRARAVARAILRDGIGPSSQTSENPDRVAVDSAREVSAVDDGQGITAGLLLCEKERNGKLVGLGIDCEAPSGKLATAGDAEQHPVIEVVLPSNSSTTCPSPETPTPSVPAPTETSTPQTAITTDPKPTTKPAPACPYTVRLLPPSTSVDLSRTLNSHALASSLTEEKFLILPGDEKGERLMLARLGWKNWEERSRRASASASAGASGTGVSVRVGMSAGVDRGSNVWGKGQGGSVGSGGGASFRSDSGPGSDSSHRTHQALAYPYTPPSLSNANPNPNTPGSRARSNSSRFPTSPFRSIKRNVQLQLATYTWPTGTSPWDHTVLIKPHEILDYLLSLGYVLLGSHVEAYGWEGGISDVHTFAGLNVAELRDRVREVQAGWRVHESGMAGQRGMLTPPRSPA